MTIAKTDDSIARVKRELAELASCLLPCTPAEAAMQDKLYVTRLLVMFLELRLPSDPIVRELRAEVELVTSRLVELGVVTPGTFARRSSPQIGGSFGGCALHTAEGPQASACPGRTSSSCRSGSRG